MKNFFKLFVLLVTMGILIILVWTTINKKHDPLVRIPVKTALLNAKPLLWLDNRYMLVSSDNKIVKFDTNNEQIVSVVSDAYSSMSYSCFSPEGGVFAVNAPVVTELENGSTQTSYENITYHWIQDWEQPVLFKKLEMAGWGNTNPHDCTHFDYKKAVSSEQIDDDIFNYDQNTPKLLRTTDGDTKSYYRYQKQKSNYERIVLIESGGSVKKVELGEIRALGQGINSFFDRTLQRYFWYIENNDFDLNNNIWPLKGWWVAPDGKVLDEITIPSGPWIKHFSTLYKLKYFSCGPTCYSNMRMYTGNGYIYIVIWGKAVDDFAKGVYQLNVKGQGWKKIIAGDIDSLVISQDGCRLSYALNNKMQIMNVCEK